MLPRLSMDVLRRPIMQSVVTLEMLQPLRWTLLMPRILTMLCQLGS